MKSSLQIGLTYNRNLKPEVKVTNNNHAALTLYELNKFYPSDETILYTNKQQYENIYK